MYAAVRWAKSHRGPKISPTALRYRMTPRGTFKSHLIK